MERPGSHTLGHSRGSKRTLCILCVALTFGFAPASMEPPGDAYPEGTPHPHLPHQSGGASLPAAPTSSLRVRARLQLQGGLFPTSTHN